MRDVNEIILCEASEKGKVVVNHCLNKGCRINTLKLEKLLIIIHGMMLAHHKKPFFKNSIVPTKNGLRIPEVDRDFIINVISFDKKFDEQIAFLDREWEMTEYIINTYGKMDTFELDTEFGLKQLNNKLLNEQHLCKAIVDGYLAYEFGKRFDVDFHLATEGRYL